MTGVSCGGTGVAGGGTGGGTGVTRRAGGGGGTGGGTGVTDGGTGGGTGVTRRAGGALACLAVLGSLAVLASGCSAPGAPSTTVATHRPDTSAAGSPAWVSGRAATRGTSPDASSASPSAASSAPSPAAAPASSAASSAPSPTPTGTSPHSSPATPTPAGPALAVGSSAWASVSVATLWRSPSSPRPVDAAALAAPARIRDWLAAMTLSQRRDLSGRADSQLLLGERVIVTGLRGSWAHVVVPDQPTPLDARGYPGWVPAVQLSARPPTPAGAQATVIIPTTWLRTAEGSHSAVTEISFGTRLPVLGEAGGWVLVATPTGARRTLSARAVAVTRPGAAALPETGVDLVRVAQMFTGVAYLWAGRSGFGFDCSGLTSLVYQVHGLTIPRDADAQAAFGAKVSGPLQPGDLMFYATTTGFIHHVSMYAGDGLMVQSPATGSSVQTIAVSTPAFASEYAGAHRYLG